MKYRLTALLLVVLLTTGCAASQPAQAPDAAESRLAQKLEALENRLEALEDALEEAAGQTAAAAPRPEAPSKETGSDLASAQTQAAPDRNAQLTGEEAEKIALDHAQFTADQVERLRTAYEIDDGIPQYDVEFYQGDWEYEFEIHAEDGQILSFDKDHRYD